MELHVAKTLEVPCFDPLPLSEAIPKNQYDLEHGLVDNISALSINEDENGGDPNSPKSGNNLENGQEKDAANIIVQGIFKFNDAQRIH